MWSTMKSKLLILWTVVAVASAGRHDVYSRNSVHGVKIQSRSDLELLATLESELDLDMWEEGMVAMRDAKVMVTPETQDIFLDTLDANGIEHYLEIADVAKVLEEEEAHLKTWNSQRTNRMIFEGFRRYAEIDAYLESIARDYPDVASLVNAGLSTQGRAIKYLKISTTNFEDRSKPVYFMDAMIHAREWVTTPVALYAIHRLVENVRSQDRDVVDTVDWIILPVVNPDGYEFTHTDFRLWRKTRSINPTNATCIGVDANRNFDVAFNTIGVSANPCSDTYPGWEPFSEPETRIIRDIMAEYRDRIQLYMNIHSHGNWILYGYGDHSMPTNAVHIHLVGSAMGAAIDAVKLPQARFYRVGNSGILLYGTSGSAQDYGQYVGIPWSYTLELPGYSYNFQVPPDYVEQINEETWRGLVVTARHAKTFYTARYVASSIKSSVYI